ncbi:MAG: flagellar protein FlaG [Thermodesulfobacteriota bacterium]|nr:flagellar protein FlaG [Thermodesulfobacteriota bacterium]
MIDNINNEAQIKAVLKNVSANNMAKAELPSKNIKEIGPGVINEGERDKKIEKKIHSVSIELIEKIKSKLNRKIRCNFSLHKETKALVVKVYDSNSGEVIREFPPEEILKVNAYLRNISGNFLDKKI